VVPADERFRPVHRKGKTVREALRPQNSWRGARDGLTETEEATTKRGDAIWWSRGHATRPPRGRHSFALVDPGKLALHGAGDSTSGSPEWAVVPLPSASSHRL